MKKFFTIALLLLAIASNVIAQDRLDLLYNQCKDESIRQYGEYLLDPKSLDDETAIRLGCSILDNKDIAKASPSLDFRNNNRNVDESGLTIGMIIAVLKTMPADIKLRQAHNFNHAKIVFFDNGKVFVSGIFEYYGSGGDVLYEATNLYANLNLKYNWRHGGGIDVRINGFLYDPFGESGFGYLVKAEESNTNYFPKAFASKGMSYEDLIGDLGGNYVIGVGMGLNLQNINGTDLFFNWLDKDNGISFSYVENRYERKLKLQKDPDYPVYVETPMRSIHWSSSDYQAFREACQEIDTKKGKAREAKEMAQEAAKWAPLKKKYGAAAFNRAYNECEVWVGMPVGLVQIYHKQVKKTQSFGGTVEIYSGFRRTVWVSNGKVTKIVYK